MIWHIVILVKPVFQAKAKKGLWDQAESGVTEFLVNASAIGFSLLLKRL